MKIKNHFALKFLKMSKKIHFLEKREKCKLKQIGTEYNLQEVNICLLKRVKVLDLILDKELFHNMSNTMRISAYPESQNIPKKHSQNLINLSD